MTDEPGAEHLLAMLEIARHDRAAIAVSPTISPTRAADLAETITARLNQVGVPPSRRAWIVAQPAQPAQADSPNADVQTAAVLAALSDAIGASPLSIHNPRAVDDLIFHRRPPDQKRGGVYLNAQWMQAAIRIACGPPAELAAGLSAWFNDPASLVPEDLSPTLVL